MQNLLNQDTKTNDLFIYDQQLAYDPNWAVQTHIIRQDQSIFYDSGRSYYENPDGEENDFL